MKKVILTFMNFIKRIIDAYRYFKKPNYLESLIKRGFVVGKNFHMLDEVIIDGSHCWHISIGDDVTLAPRVHILAHDASTWKFLGITKVGKVNIGNRVFIGASSIILPGVTIGDDVIIGAGSVITKDITDGVVVAGNPAKIIAKTEEFLSKRESETQLYPCFSEEYTVRNHINSDLKNEMNQKITNKFGFLITKKN